MTEKNNHARWTDYLLLTLVLSGLCFLFWRVSIGQHLVAAAERESIRSEMVREFQVLSEVYGKRIVKSEQSAWVAADATGVIIDMNDRAKAELKLKIGGRIEECMREADREHHRKHYLTAQAMHAAGNPQDGTSPGEVLGPDGEWHDVIVERWTVLGGSQSFITRVKE